jgi:hypothetical protein
LKEKESKRTSIEKWYEKKVPKRLRFGTGAMTARTYDVLGSDGGLGNRNAQQPQSPQLDSQPQLLHPHPPQPPQQQNRRMRIKMIQRQLLPPQPLPQPIVTSPRFVWLSHLMRAGEDG